MANTEENKALLQKRLAELKGLLDDKIITEDEHVVRRQQMIDNYLEKKENALPVEIIATNKEPQRVSSNPIEHIAEVIPSTTKNNEGKTNIPSTYFMLIGGLVFIPLGEAFLGTKFFGANRLYNAINYGICGLFGGGLGFLIAGLVNKLQITRKKKIAIAWVVVLALILISVTAKTLLSEQAPPRWEDLPDAK